MTYDIQSSIEHLPLQEKLERLNSNEGLASGPAARADCAEIKRARRLRLQTADQKPPGADDRRNSVALTMHSYIHSGALSGR